MSQTQSPIDPEAYVRENREKLSRVIKHSDDEFTRALALAALMRYGPDPDLDHVRDEIDSAEEVLG